MTNTMMLSAVYTAIDKVTTPVRKMTASIDKFGGSLNDNGRKMREWGAKVSAGAILAREGGNIVKNAVLEMSKPFFEVEQQMAGLENVIKSSGNNQVASMQAAKKAAVDWEKTHSGSAAKFIEMTAKMSAANFKEVDAIRGSRHALTLATGTMSDANVASELLIYSYQTLGNKTKGAADEMKKHADMTAKVQKIYSMRGIGEFTDAMKDAMPAAALMKQKYEEAAVAVGTLQRAGWQGGKAGGSYAAMLGTMEKASGELGFTLVKNSDGAMDFVATIDKLSNKFGDMRKLTPEIKDKLKAAFGDDGLRMLMVFQQQSGQMKKSMEDLRNSTGAAAKARDNLENTGFGKMEKYLQQLNSLKVNFAEKIFGNTKIMDEVIPKFIGFIEWAVNLGIAFAETNPRLTNTLLIIGAIGAGILLIVAPILMVIGSMITMGGVALSAFGTALGSVSEFYKFVSSGDALKKGQKGIELLSSKYTALKGHTKNAALAVKDFGLKALTAGKNAAVAGLTGIKSFTLGLFSMAKAAIMTAVTALPGLIAKTWAFTAALLANPLTWVVIGIMALIGAIALCIIYWDDIKIAASNAWDWIKEAASSGIDFLMALPGRYIDFLGGIYSMFFDAGAKLWTTFADGIKSVVTAPLEWIKSGINLIDEYLPHSDAKRGALSRLTSSGQSLLTTFASGIPKGYDALKNVVAKGLDFIKFPDEQDPFAFSFVGQNKSIFDDTEGTGLTSFFSGNKSNPIHIQNLTIKVEKMENPEDFAKTLQIFVDESGG